MNKDSIHDQFEKESVDFNIKINVNNNKPLEKFVILTSPKSSKSKKNLASRNTDYRKDNNKNS